MSSMRFPRKAIFWIILVVAIIAVSVASESIVIGLLGGAGIMLALWLLYIILARLFQVGGIKIELIGINTIGSSKKCPLYDGVKETVM